MTALTTSPFLTLPPGMASLTVQTMTSPMPAYRRPEPPSTRMHRTSLAPVLSATLSRDSCWITSGPPIDCSRKERSGRSGESSGVRSLGTLHYLNDAPALRGGERAGLHDLDAVAD